MAGIKHISESFGMDFDIKYTPDEERELIYIIDHFGFFLPVTFEMWVDIIDKKLFPKIVYNNPLMDVELAYYAAVKIFCKQYVESYIGLN